MGLKEGFLGRGWRRLSDNSGGLGEHIGVELEAHSHDGSPSGRLSSRTDRPLLHAADQLFSEPPFDLRWSAAEAGVSPRHPNLMSLA